MVSVIMFQSPPAQGVSARRVDRGRPRRLTQFQSPPAQGVSARENYGGDISLPRSGFQSPPAQGVSASERLVRLDGDPRRARFNPRLRRESPRGYSPTSDEWYCLPVSIPACAGSLRESRRGARQGRDYVRFQSPPAQGVSASLLDLHAMAFAQHRFNPRLRRESPRAHRRVHGCIRADRRFNPRLRRESPRASVRIAACRDRLVKFQSPPAQGVSARTTVGSITVDDSDSFNPRLRRESPRADGTRADGTRADGTVSIPACAGSLREVHLPAQQVATQAAFQSPPAQGVSASSAMTW